MKLKSIIIFIMLMGLLAIGATAIVGCADDGCDDCDDAMSDEIDKRGMTDCEQTQWGKIFIIFPDCWECTWYDPYLGGQATIRFCSKGTCGCSVDIIEDIPPPPEDEYVGFNSSQDSEQDYAVIKSEEIEIHFSQEEIFKENAIISFGVSTHLTEYPIVSLVTDCGVVECYVEYTLHDSGITTGVIYVPCDNPSYIYFNEYETNYGS